MNKDFDFIKSRFDNDGITAPISLDEQAAANIIDGKPYRHIRFYEKRSFKAAVSLVACVAIMIGCISYASDSNVKLISDNDTKTVSGGISYFDSYGDMKRTMKDIGEREALYTKYGLLETVDEASAVDKNVQNEATSSSYGMGGDEGDHGSTYTQVDGVDEADIVKNDGKYIYVVGYPYYRNEVVRIYEANGMKPKLVAELKDEFLPKDDKTLKDQYICINEIYVKDNRLIVNFNRENFLENDIVDCISNTVIYDVSDMSNIRLISSFEQSGYYNSSRMIDDTMYILTVKDIQRYMIKDFDTCIPYTVSNGKREALPASSICCPEKPNENSFLVISAIDTKTGKQTKKSKAILGCSGIVYCNKNNLYVAIAEFSLDDSKTDILKVNISDGIKFAECTSVKGTINNQFSMDEYNGYLRVATTAVKYTGDAFTTERSNNLYILDNSLKMVGKVESFAENENIQAVKFMGDTAYVITYMNTDPLFVIDLKDPKKPKILGSVEIDGYSSQLLTIGENRVLGIGYHSDTENAESGLKIVLFDTTDKTAPKVLDSYVMLDAGSNAQNNHKAICINKEKGYYAIDFDRFTVDDEGNEHFNSGALTFEIDNDMIIVTHIFDYNKTYNNFEDFYYPLRTTYIDDVVYSIDSHANIYAFQYE